MQALLEHFKQHYDNPPVIIYENGMFLLLYIYFHVCVYSIENFMTCFKFCSRHWVGYGLSNNDSLPLPDALNDKSRVAYLHDYLESLLAAVRYVNQLQYHIQASKAIHICLFLQSGAVVPKLTNW